MKISPYWASRLIALEISICMSFLMSGAMFAINNGTGGTFFKRWMRSWAIGFVVAYPTASIIVPFSRRWVESSTNQSDNSE